MVNESTSIERLNENTLRRTKSKLKSKRVPWIKDKHWSDEMKQKISCAVKAFYENHPELRTRKTKRRIEHLQKLSNDPEVARKRSETMIKLWSTHEFRQRQSKGMKAVWQRRKKLEKLLES